MIYRFEVGGERISVDTATRELRRGSRIIPAEPKVFDVLVFLIGARDRMVPRDELLAACWPEVHVSDGTLSRCLSRVRQAIGQDRQASEPIQTRHARGYRFVGTLDVEGPPPPDAAAGTGETAAPAAEREAAREAERRPVTLLDCSVERARSAAGAAANAPDTADSRFRLVETFLASARPILARTGGTLTGTRADGFSARFGDGAALEQAAEAAVLAAQALAGTGRGLGLAVRTGIASGRAVLGGPGDATLLVPLDAVPAAGIRALAGPGECLLDAQTAALLRPGDRPLPAALPTAVAHPELPGEALHRLTSAEPAAPGHPPPGQDGDGEGDGDDLPFIGRETEVVFLEQVWRQAGLGRGRVLHLTGEPGIGKSRMVRELARRAGLGPDAVLRLPCSAHHQLTPFHPLLLALREILGVGPDDPPLVQLAAVEGLLARLGRPETDHLPLLASLLSVSMPAAPPPRLRLSPERQHGRTQDALLFLATARARSGPSILWVDDAQWADPSTLATLARLRERIAAGEAGSLLLILARRPVPDGGGEPAALAPAEGDSRLALTPLPKASTLRFLERLSMTGDLPSGLIGRIASRSDGVPLYLREVLRMTGHAGARAPEVSGAAAEGVPETLRALLLARLEGVGETARTLAQWAALFGREVRRDVLARVCGLDTAAFDAALSALAAAGLTGESSRGGARTVSFVHGLLRDAAYEAMIDDQRRARHGHAAEILVGEFPEIAMRLPEEVARHYEASDTPERAADFWTRAGDASSSHHADVEARALYARAIAAARSDPAPDAAATIAEIETLLAALGPDGAPTRPCGPR